MSRIAKILPGLAVVGAVSIVGAQTDPAAVPPPVAPTTTASSKMSATDMTAAVAVSEGQIEETGRQIIHLKDTANRQKDVIKLTCLNDKLIQFKAQRNIWDANKATFQVAITKSDSDRIAAYDALAGTGRSIQELRDQANACVGEPELFKQEAGVEVNDPAFPDDPTADDPFDPTITDVEPPGYASPFY